MPDLHTLDANDTIDEALSRNLDHSADLTMARVNDIATGIRRATFTLTTDKSRVIYTPPLADVVASLAQIARIARTTAEQLVPEAIRRHVDICKTCTESHANPNPDRLPAIDRNLLCEAGEVIYDNLMLAIDDEYTYAAAIAH